MGMDENSQNDFGIPVYKLYELAVCPNHIIFKEVKKMEKKFYKFSIFAVVLSMVSAVLVSVAPMRDGYVSVEKDGFIKWVDFNATYEAMADCLAYDTETYQTEKHACWIDLLAILAAKGNGTFENYKTSDLSKITDEIAQGRKIE